MREIKLINTKCRVKGRLILLFSRHFEICWRQGFLIYANRLATA